jgi:hypothetical protein
MGLLRCRVHASVVLYALVHLSLATACGERAVVDEPEDTLSEVRIYAEARCARLRECGCDPDPASSSSECEDRVVETYLAMRSEDVDATCFKTAGNAWKARACDGRFEVDGCALVPPDGQVGDACSEDAFGDALLLTSGCAPDLACFEGRCVDPTMALDEGMPCSAGTLCDVGLTCLEGQCVERRLDGETCSVSADCEPVRDYYCNGVCTPKKVAGDICASRLECTAAYLCADGVCAAPDSVLCLMRTP